MRWKGFPAPLNLFSRPFRGSVFCHLPLNLNFLVNSDGASGLGTEHSSFIQSQEARDRLPVRAGSVCLALGTGAV